MIDGTNDGCWDITSGTFGDYAANVTDAIYCKVNLNVFFFFKY